MKKQLIKSVHIVDPSQNLDGIMDILITDGLIEKIEKEIPIQQTELLDAKGLTVVPGLVDMHIHLRDPGFTHKEDILSGCKAAASGGFTSVVCMPNSNPICDSAETVQYIKEKAKQAYAKVYPTCSISNGLKGQMLTDFAKLKQAGAIAFSDDGRPVENAKLMLEALLAAKEIDSLIISHAEDLSIISGGIINEGQVSKALGVKGMHPASEDSATAREIALACATNTKIHIAHVSTKGSIALIRDAKKRGVCVTCETAPHYFMLTEQKLLGKDANFRMNPPLRTENDRQAILEGICDGTIDAIATDHAPHTAAEKQDFLTAPNGVVGLETSFGACMTALVHGGLISFSRLIELMSLNPSKILDLNAGTLKAGSPADMTFVDLNEHWVVDSNQFFSKSHNTTFEGFSFKGKAKYTLVDGNNPSL